MPFVDSSRLKVIERRPGWHGRIFHSPSMTFSQIARPGIVAIVPGNVSHSVKALTDGKAIIVDYPLRHDVG